MGKAAGGSVLPPFPGSGIRRTPKQIYRFFATNSEFRMTIPSAFPPAAPHPSSPDPRQALLFALAAERLSAYYEHGQWITVVQGASLAESWLLRGAAKREALSLAERRRLSELSDGLARHLAASLSREAGLYTAHEMMEALDPNYRSELVFDLLDECARLLRESGQEAGA